MKFYCFGFDSVKYRNLTGFLQIGKMVLKKEFYKVFYVSYEISSNLISLNGVQLALKKYLIKFLISLTYSIKLNKLIKDNEIFQTVHHIHHPNS